MAPKKQFQKMALSDFLQDSSLGSWADEMDSLPSAPAARADDGSRGREYGGRTGGFDDYPGRESRYPPREELPLPTAPPYTSFVGNLAFDVSEEDVEAFFQVSLKSIKIIKDRDDKPKGFGYVEFGSLQDLKDGLAKSGGQMAGRTVRVSVAEPQKERSDNDDKFSNPWRRDGPLPSSDRGGGSSRGPPSRYGDEGGGEDRGARMGFGSKFVPSTDSPRSGPGGSSFRSGPERTPADPAAPSEAETNSDWRGSRRAPPPAPERPGPVPRKAPGFGPNDGTAHAADAEDTWAKGSKFSPSLGEQAPVGGAARKPSFFARGDPAARPAEEEPNDWRSAPRRGPAPPANPRQGSFDRGASDSVPTTPNMSRRKLELLPRTASQSTATSPVGSPKSSTPTGAGRANPFGAARPVDAAAREKEIEEKLARDREARLKDRSNDPPTRSAERTPAPTPAEGGWRDRRTGPSAGNSRPASASHSRNTSHEGGALTPPTKKSQAPFSFAALASEIEVVEGEDEDDQKGINGQPKQGAEVLVE